MGGKGKGFQEQLQRTHGQNQGGWNQGSEVGMAGVGEGWEENADNCSSTTIK